MTQLSDLSERVKRNRRLLDRRVGEARYLAQQGKELTEQLSSARSRIETIEQAIAVLTSIGEERQQMAQQQIETLVTHGLRTIFEEDISFHVVTSVKGKQPVVDFVVRSKLDDGSVVDTPVMGARGGGLAAIVGFLLRVVVLLLTPNRAPLLVLDEAFAQVSEEYEPRLVEFIRELVDRTPLQVVLVTHSHAYTDAADRVYRFSLKGGLTSVEAVTGES